MHFNILSFIIKAKAMGLRKYQIEKRSWFIIIHRNRFSFSSNKNVPFLTVLSFILEKGRYFNIINRFPIY